MSEILLETAIHKAPNLWDSGASVTTTNKLSSADRLKRLTRYDDDKFGLNRALRKRGSGLLEHDQPKLSTRLFQCRHVPHGQSDVELWGDCNGHSHFRGLKTCGSVWCCPDCSWKICKARKCELDKLLKYWRDNNIAIFMMTMTFVHRRTEALASNLEAMKGAWKTLQQRIYWRSQVMPVRDGSVTATEVTWGDRNGWHPHMHVLIGIDMNAADAEERVAEIRGEWADAGASHGLDTSQEAAFNLRRADAAGVYVSKFGAAGEMALATEKVGRKGSLTPWQLQRLAEGESDPVMRRHYGYLWKEYALAFHGKRQLVWSNGLKTRAKISDTSDAELAAQEEASGAEVLLRRWSSDAPSWIEARARSAALLRAAAEGGDLREAEFGPTDEQRESEWRQRVRKASAAHDSERKQERRRQRRSGHG